jgi:hypothetical protein
MATTQLPPDFKEFIQYMNSEQVEYLLVGGYAVGFHGAPRFTADMDIWVRGQANNAAKLGRVLASFGFRNPEFTSGEFLLPGKVYRFGVPPLQIDILTTIAGCDFEECYSRRDRIVRDGVEVSVLSIGDLRTNKKAAGRAKDLADLEGLT